MKTLSDLVLKLVDLRDNYSDEIPKEIIHGKLRYKVQKNWFTIFGMTMHNAINSKVIDNSTIQDKFYELCDYFEETDIENRDSTKTDIEKTNQFLNTVIQYCNDKVKS